ncbi:MAG: PDZ domain-containing protein [Desulfobacteraceae bacterium]|nr:PDZ domain-containing protein [Desulfobacteraceae bacterium]
MGALESGEIAQGAVQAWLKAYDPYGEYLSPEEYRAWKVARNHRFSGVGMELLIREGRFFLIPRPFGPAQKAGIAEGDELLAVDGAAVKNRPLFWVGSRIRGRKDTRVTLKILRSGRASEVSIFRQPMKDQSVWPVPSEEFLILRISHFSPHTLAELKATLKSYASASRLVLDLRNNPGGDLFAAVDAAGLFLAPGLPVLTIETPRGKVTYKAKGQIWKGEKTYIWQNGFTASASEVLTRALTAHGRAVNLGTKSFGKAMTQKVVELSDGSALVISRGRLYGPHGRSWQDEGIRPKVMIQNLSGSWTKQTRQLLK